MVLPAAGRLAAQRMAQPSTIDSIRYFGDYWILGEIARGGMGVVYLARQNNLNREVALKLILAGVLASRREIEQFHVEAEAAAALNHPHIVHVYESGEHEGQPFVAMELIQGSSLAEQLEEGAWRFTSTNAAERQTQIAGLVLKLAEAVHHAHQRGVIHRDLKPSNVLLNEEGEPFVTDFGLAKLVGGRAGLTQTGQVLGTPSFMSPEQAAGRTKDVTVASDVYGLGAILFSLLTGQPPFRGATDVETLDWVRHREPPRPRGLNSAVHPDLETICLKCLEKEPARRYSSAEAMRDDLQHWLRGEPITARPVTVWERIWKWILRHPGTAALIGIIVFSLGAGALGVTWQWRRAEAGWASATRVNARLRLQQSEDLFQQGDSALALATLARALRDDPSNRAVEERLVNAFLARGFFVPATNTPSASEAADFGLALDSQTSLRIARCGVVLAVATNAENILVSQSGTDTTTKTFMLPRPGVIRSLALSADGHWLAAGVANGDACVWNLRSGQLAATLPHPAAVYAVDFSAVSPVLATAAADGVVRLWSIDSFQLTRQTPAHHGAVNIVRFSPTELALATGGDDGVIRMWRADPLTALVEPRSLGASVEDLLFNADGSRLFARTRRTTVEALAWGIPSPPARLSNVVTRTPDLNPLPFVLGVAATNFHPLEITFTNLSSDGSRLATASADRTARVWDVKTRRPLTEQLLHAAAVNCVRFSPDGLRVVTSGADGRLRVWDAASGASLTDWLQADAPVFEASFSNDGRQVFASNGQAWPIHRATGELPSWLPDLAEALAGLRFDEQGLREPISHSHAAETCRRLAVETKDSPQNGWLPPLLRQP